MKNNSLFLALVSITAIFLFAACGSVEEEVAYETACNETGGIWVPETLECEGMQKNQCEELGGVFDECASACRNNPDAVYCTLQCVMVCDF